MVLVCLVVNRWPVTTAILDKVANKILALREGGVREFFGNYTDYLDEKPSLQEQSALLEKEKRAS